MTTSIAWLIPKLIEGSGGHRTILQHAAALEAAGFECRLYIEPDQHKKGQAAAEIQRLFGYVARNAVYGWDRIEPADLVFATVWYSARFVRDLPFPCRKAYFVQDYEACFNPMGDAYVMAENSYRYGLHPITIGRWLTQQLRHSFNVPAEHFDFCADLSIYRPLPNVSREKAVCFIHQPEKPRRCSRLGVEALGIVKNRMPDTRIYLYGSAQKGELWYPHQDLGLLKLEDCNALYNRSAIGLCLSSSNPSRIPFEMMAAGLPVVELWRDNTLYDLPQQATLLCDQTPESLAEGIMQLFAAPERREQMSQAGIEYMRGRPLQLGFDQFVDSVRRLLAGTANSSVAPVHKLYTRPALVSHHFERTLPVIGSGKRRRRKLSGRLAAPFRRAGRFMGKLFTP